MAELTEKQLEEAGKFVKDYFQDLSVGHNRQVKLWDKYQKMWEGKPADTQYSGGLSNLVVNEMHKSTETFVGSFMSLLDVVDPFFDVRGELGEELPEANKIRSLTNYQLQKCNFRDKYEDSVRTLTLEGTLVYKVIWDVSTIQYKNYQKENGDFKKNSDGQRELYEVNEIFNSAQYIPLDNRNVYYDYTIEDFSKQKGIIEVEDASLSSIVIKGNDEEYIKKNVAKLKDKYFKENKEKDIKAGLKVKLLHYSGGYDVESNGVPQEYVIIADEKFGIVLYCETNPYNHCTRKYRQVKFLPKKGSGLGMGLGELMGRSQMELNDNRKKIADNATMLLAKMKTVKRTANIDKNQAKMRPFGWIDVNDHGDIKELETNNFIEAGILLERLIKDDFQSTTGATFELSGVGTEAKTAHQSQMLLRQGMAKMSSVLSRVDRNLIEETLSLIYLLTRQYMPIKQQVLIAGGSLVEVSPLEYIVNAKFKALGSKYIQENMVQLQQDIQLLSIIGQMPGYEQATKQLIKDIFLASGKKDITKYLPEPPPMVPTEAGAITQGVAGVTPQMNATPDATSLLRMAGKPAVNQEGV